MTQTGSTGVKTGSALVTTAYDYILGKILSTEWKPGTVVSDYQLSRALDMSRTPIREAMKRLVYETLLVQAEHNKVVVSGITAEDVFEITDVRTALEQQAVETIITRRPMGEGEIARLRHLNDEVRRTIEQKRYTENFDLEDAFHFAIVDASGNRRLMEMYRRIHLLILRARWLSLFDPNYEITYGEHAAIIDGIAARDLHAAVAAMRRHMESSRRHFSRVFEEPALRRAMEIVASSEGAAQMKTLPIPAMSGK